MIWEDVHNILLGQRKQNQVPFFFLFFGGGMWGGPCCAACGILVPWPGIEPTPSAVKAWSANHWTAREFPKSGFKWYIQYDPNIKIKNTGNTSKCYWQVSLSWLFRLACTLESPLKFKKALMIQDPIHSNADLIGLGCCCLGLRIFIFFCVLAFLLQIFFPKFSNINMYPFYN